MKDLLPLVVIGAVIAAVAVWSGALSTLGFGATIADDITGISCGSDWVKVTIAERGKATSFAEGDWCFYAASSLILNHQECKGVWELVDKTSPTLLVARWNGHDILQFYDGAYVRYEFGNPVVCTKYIEPSNTIANHLYEEYTELDSSNNEEDLVYRFLFTVPSEEDSTPPEEQPDEHPDDAPEEQPDEHPDDAPDETPDDTTDEPSGEMPPIKESEMLSIILMIVIVLAIAGFLILRR